MMGNMSDDPRRRLGRGVIVDAGGQLLGSVTAAQVVERIDHEAAASRKPAAAAPSPAEAGG